MEQLQVTSLEKLKEMGKGRIVELPSFYQGEDSFVARLKRPNILNLLSAGKIPNALVHAVDALMFDAKDHSRGKKELSKEEEIKQITEMSQLLTIIAKETLLEPSFKDLEDAGLELTDEQIMRIFNFTQEGVKSLEPFCANDESDANN